MAKLSNDRLQKFRPQVRNANRHTQRGHGMLETSMRKYGYVAPMTAAANGEMIDGSDRLETSATVFDDDVIVVEHDGTKPVIMVRTDIPSADSPEARAISIAANRVAAVNLDFDPEVILADLQQGVDLSAFWFPHELDALTNVDAGEFDPAAEWQGMPEFEQDNLQGLIVRVHFANETDRVSFFTKLGVKFTDKTNSIWYPGRPENLRNQLGNGLAYSDES